LLNMFSDLHVHTNFSDGTFSPVEIIVKAKKLNISTIAITDHNTIQAFSDEVLKLAKAYGIHLIPGIELSSSYKDKSKFHIIGLGINYRSTQLRQSLISFHKKRMKYLTALIYSLNNSGYFIPIAKNFKTLNEIKDYISLNYNLKNEELINILNSNKNYVKYINHYFEIEEALNIIRKAGGVSILAHLNFISNNNEEIENIVKEMKDLGLNGIEAFHSNYTMHDENLYLSIANKYGLLISGGSDFHGLNRQNVQLGCLMIDDEKLTVLKYLDNFNLRNNNKAPQNDN